MSDKHPVTALLRAWRVGEESALEQLTPLVYEELRKRAGYLFSGESAGHTLQPTALVNELYGRLVDVEVDWQDRAHFYALCSRIMRHILVDHAKASRATKRGGNMLVVSLDETGIVENASEAQYRQTETEDLISLDQALQQLATLDKRKADLLEMQVFGGLTFREMGAVTGLSESTLDRDLRFARAWLRSRLATQSV